MKRKNIYPLYVIVLCVIALLTSCKTTKDYHDYSYQKSFELRYDYDDVWNQVVDIVADKNYVVTNIEKESGIITMQAYSFNASMQKNGINSKDSYYSVQYDRGLRNKKLYVIGNWNIRVKRVNDWITQISVNLTENGKVMYKETNGTKKYINKPNRSTGKFEKQLLYMILDKIRINDLNYDRLENYEYSGENH